MRSLLLLSVVMLLSVPLFGAVETSQPPYFNVLVSPQNFDNHPASGTFYNASVIQVAGTLYIYAQGGQWGPNRPPSMCEDHDQILVFSIGMSQLMSAPAMYRDRVSGDCTENYGVGNVFQSRGQYNIIADKSDTTTFSNLVWLHSTDPVSGWTEEPLLSTDLPIHILDMVLVPASDTYWWGLFRFGSGFPNSVGRVRVDFSSGQKRVYVLSGGTFQEAVGGDLTFTPDAVANGTYVNDLFHNGSYYESWEYYYVSQNGCGPCPGGYGSPHGNGDVGTAFQLRAVSESTFGAPEQVYSEVRCLPSDYEVGRMFPARIDYNGNKYLISSENDVAICYDGLFSPFQGMRVVVTRLQ